MRILQISDLHGFVGFIDTIATELANADLVVFSGDLTNFEGYKRTSEIINKTQSINRNVLAVPGNWDGSGVDRCLQDLNCSVDQTWVEFQDYHVYGIGGSIPCPGKTPNEFTETEFEEKLDAITPTENAIYIIHQPPFETMLDRINSGAHVGSRAVKNFLQRAEGILCMSGHIHESPGVDKIGGITVINPGPARHGCYAVIEVSGFAPEVDLRTT